MKDTIRHAHALILTVSILCLGPGSTPVTAAGPGLSGPAVRVAPPPPVINNSDRLAELAERRARVAQRLRADGMLVLLSGEARVYTNDVDYEFRMENNLFYLTNLRQKDVKLILLPGGSAPREILFIPKRDPSQETWTGHMYDAAEASGISGITEIWDTLDFDPFVKALAQRSGYSPKSRLMSSAALAGPALETATAELARKLANIYLLTPADEDHREFVQELALREQLSRGSAGHTILNAAPIFADMRLRKSASELKYLQHAIDISAEAIGRAMSIAGKAQFEFEVKAEVDYTFRRRNADNWGYPSIVGCGPNGTTLHYEESQGKVMPGNLILMDVGAEYGHYSADVTRTFPVNGKFTRAQAEIYQIVFDAQEAAAQAIKPGANLRDVHNAALAVIKDGLLRLGLITDKNSMQYRYWFMHGTSHWLGMNVHDVGGGATPFEPGMVFTNEPGIYIRADALDNLPVTADAMKFRAAVQSAFDKYKNIGVRIEDDMLVTATGADWLTKNIPRSIADIEATMTRAQAEPLVSQTFGAIAAQSAGKAGTLFNLQRSFVGLSFRSRGK